MRRLLLDSCVWLAWARADDEPHHAAASAIIERRRRGEIELRLLDLTLYEVGNTVIRRWRLPVAQADGLVTRLGEIAGVPPLVPSPTERHAAHVLAEQHGLSVYDATYAAVVRARHLTLVSVDGLLLDAGLAVAPGAV
jgi:predicted nucleic acid-binding protein